MAVGGKVLTPLHIILCTYSFHTIDELHIAVICYCQACLSAWHSLFEICKGSECLLSYDLCYFQVVNYYEHGACYDHWGRT